MTSGLLAEFSTPEEMVQAIAKLRSEGYRELETYSPYLVPGAEPHLGLGRSSLPKFVFGGGLIGAVLGYWIQWFANVWDYPQNVGGRPLHAVAAFIPATFEACVLGAALTAFFGLFVALRLPQPWHPVFEIEGFERASIDRFWLGIDAKDPHFDAEGSRRVLAELVPLRVVRVGEGG